MCGRYYLHITMERLLERYGIKEAGIDLNPREEIFPSEFAPVVIKEQTETPDEKGTSRDIRLFKWGFSPFYQKRLVINARAETIATRPLFKEAFRQRRCLIPASGFFEWQGEKGKKRKHRIFLKDEQIISLAGLYSPFQDESGQKIDCFTIITTSASSKIKKIHDRMPVILTKDLEDYWLNHEQEDLEKLKDLLQPYDDSELYLEIADKKANSQQKKPDQLGFDFD